MRYIKNRGFTLIEMLVVIIILGILAAVALPNFTKMKEHALDKEAIANLKLIQAAEKIYRMETGSYIACTDTSAVNTNLKLSLPTGPTRNWSYWTDNTGLAEADPYPRGGGHFWDLRITEAEPTCHGTGCP